MSERKILSKLSRMDIEIGITILLCFVLSHVANKCGLHVEALAVTTGSIMCVQDSGKTAYKTSLIRMLGVVCGGLIGMGIVAIDNVVGSPWVFYLLCSAGVVVNMVLCKYCGLNFIQARVSSITMLLVVMVFEGADRFQYAVGRFVGSLVGALIALLVSVVFSVIDSKRGKR